MADQDWQSRLKTGRNDECPCGSKKKYKKCHLEQDEKAKSAALAEANAEAAKNAPADDHEGHEHHGHDPLLGGHGHLYYRQGRRQALRPGSRADQASERPA